jgi:curved DNA-binding protein CbpA
MLPAGSTDFYETLQISPNADPETIHRIYRILAQRFHPDNQETGNALIFQTLTAAYHVLGDPEKRAAYDVEHRQTRRLNWKIFDQTNAALGVEGERRKREGVLALLYRKRVAQPDQSYLMLKDMEDLLGIPKEHLEFALWYLRESQLVQRGDNGRFVITLKGVEMAEAVLDRKSAVSLLPAPARAAAV